MVDHIDNGESGLIVRGKLNEVIDRTNTLNGIEDKVETNKQNIAKNATEIDELWAHVDDVEDTIQDLDVAVLDGKIDQEILDRAEGDANLQSQLDQEIVDRTDGDAALQSQIDALENYDDTQIKADLATETQARVDGDAALQDQIDALLDQPGAGMVISDTEPDEADRVEGLQWLDSTTAEVWIWDGVRWLEFPAGSGGLGLVTTGMVATEPDVLFRDAKGRFKSTKGVPGLANQMEVNRWFLEQLEGIEPVELPEMTNLDTPNTLVLRDENGNARFNGVTTKGIVFSQGSVSSNLADTWFLSGGETSANGVKKNDAEGMRSSLDVYSKAESDALVGDAPSLLYGSWNYNSSSATSGAFTTRSANWYTATTLTLHKNDTSGYEHSFELMTEGDLIVVQAPSGGAEYKIVSKTADTDFCDFVVDTISAFGTFPSNGYSVDFNFVPQVSADGGSLWEQNGDDIFYDKGDVSVSGTLVAGGNLESSSDGASVVVTNSYGNEEGAAGLLLSRPAVKGNVFLNCMNDGSSVFSVGPTGNATFSGTIKQTVVGYGQIVLDGTDTSSEMQIINTNHTALRFINHNGGIVFQQGTDANNLPFIIQADGNALFSGSVSVSGGFVERPAHAGIHFTNNAIWPAKDGVTANSSIDLGNPSYRWRVIYGATARMQKVIQDGSPVIDAKGLINTLSTLRNATKDETTLEGMRDALADAIGGLIENLEHEISTMPAPEPEVSTMEISE